MKYELLLFDADGTLFDFELAEKHSLRKSFESFGVRYIEDFHLNEFKKVNTIIWQEFEEKKISADDLKTERFRRLFANIDFECDPQEFSDNYLANLAESKFLIHGAEALISELYSRHKLAIITNGLTRVQKPRLGTSQIGKYFEEIIISEEINSPKPDKRIFEISMQRMNHNNKETTLIIGDKLSSDILGGNLFGIDTCWYNPKKMVNNSEITPTYEIQKLEEIITIVA